MKGVKGKKETVQEGKIGATDCDRKVEIEIKNKTLIYNIVCAAIPNSLFLNSCPPLTS